MQVVSNNEILLYNSCKFKSQYFMYYNIKYLLLNLHVLYKDS